MGSKNKLKRFNQNKTFSNVIQPEREEVTSGGFQYKGKWNGSFFKKEQPLVLELGCGKGEYSVYLAQQYPEKNFIGVDIKGARFWAGAKESLALGLKNVAFLRTQIELIEDGLMRELERSFLLQKIDSSWKDHLQSMNALRETIAWRGYGQKDPLIEYKNEAYVLFTSMVTNIRHSVTYLIFRSQPILKI